MKQVDDGEHDKEKPEMNQVDDGEQDEENHQMSKEETDRLAVVRNQLTEKTDKQLMSLAQDHHINAEMWLTPGPYGKFGENETVARLTDDTISLEERKN